MTYLVEKWIRKKELIKIGLYVQTCGHIEEVLWQVCFLGFPCDPDDEKCKNKVLGLRNNTSELLKALKSLAETHNSNELRDIIERIEEGKETRNGIIHGALFFINENQGDKLFKHQNAKRKPEYEWVNYEDPIRAEYLDVALAHADSILGDALHVLREFTQLSDRTPTG